MKLLSEETFKTLAGDGAYQRGVGYYNDGRVGPLSIQGARISAQVAGTEPYHVELHHTARVFEGNCTCPASDGFDFCKHCVAVALSYYYQTQTNQELSASSEENRLLEYLNTLTKPQLAEELHTLLVSNPAAMDQWQLKAAVASGSFGAAEIRKQITKALPYKPAGLWRHRDVAEYFDNAESILRALQEPLEILAPDAIEKLLAYAFQRMEKLLQTIDDSGGYRFPVEALLRHWFAQMVISDQWSTEQKAASIVHYILDSGYACDTLDLPDSVASLVSADTLQKVYSQIESHWSGLTPSKELFSDAHAHYRKLEQILLNKVRADGEVEKEMDILAKGAVSVDRSLELVHRAIDTQRLDEARKWLRAAGHFDEPGTRELYAIESAQIELWKAEKKYAQALAAQWARFEEQEQAELLQAAIDTATSLGQAEQVLADGITHLNTRLNPRDNSHRNRRRAETLAAVYLSNERVGDAAALAQRMPLSNATLHDIIKATQRIDKHILRLIKRVAQRLIDADRDRSYTVATRFLLKQQQRIEPALQTAFHQVLQQLFDEPKNKRKPNLIKLMRNSFNTLH